MVVKGSEKEKTKIRFLGRRLGRISWKKTWTDFLTGREKAAAAQRRLDLVKDRLD